MPRSAAVTAVLAVTIALALAGCVDAGTAPSVPTGTSTPAPTPTTGPTTTPTPVDEPLAVSCGELVDADAVYAFDPNYALLDSWDPAAGTPAAEAVAAGGVACQLVRESGGGTIDLSVASLGEDELTAKKNAAFAESTMVPTYGDEAYFSVDGGVGTAIVFDGPYWLVISSESFAEPGEPTEIIDAALAALPAG
jgi:hypothetical protein